MADVPNAPEFSTHIGSLLLRAHRDYAQRAIAKLRAAGYADLAQHHAELLATMAADGERISSIAGKLGTSKQAAGEAVGQLERMGYLRKTADASDSRATIAELTPKGRRFIEEVRGIKQDLNRDYVARLGSADFDALRAILERLLAE